MYHIHNTNARYQWDDLSIGHEDWARMNKQFKYIKENCPKLEFVTISEAVKIYLDRYSPDIIALRTNEKKINDEQYMYDIKFLGSEIEVSEKRPHYVSVKPPSYFIGQIKKVELIHNDIVLRTWNDIQDYSDLNFTITGKEGYSLRVYL
jgi:hypothetical protein